MNKKLGQKIEGMLNEARRSLNKNVKLMEEEATKLRLAEQQNRFAKEKFLESQNTIKKLEETLKTFQEWGLVECESDEKYVADRGNPD